MTTANSDQILSLKRIYDMIKDNQNKEQEAHHLKQVIKILESQK
jgi:hypothetical protein